MFRIPLWDDHSHTPNRGLQCEHLGYRSKWGGASDISLGWSASAAFCCVDFISEVHVRSVPRLERWRRKTMPWQHGRHRLRQVTTMALRPKPWHDGLYMFIYICIYIRGIILIISPQGSGSWIIIIYLECYGVVPPIWFPCRVFFSPIVWCPFWISFAAQKKYHFEVHSSDQTWQWKIMVLKSISVNEACSFAMFDYMWVLSCMRSHGV